MVLAVSLVAVVLLIVGGIAVHPALPRHTPAKTAVLVSAGASTFCAEGVAQADGYMWGTTSDSIDHLRLPMRGKVEIIDAGTAVFTARHVHVRLSPAMPCTAG